MGNQDDFRAKIKPNMGESDIEDAIIQDRRILNYGTIAILLMEVRDELRIFNATLDDVEKMGDEAAEVTARIISAGNALPGPGKIVLPPEKKIISPTVISDPIESTPTIIKPNAVEEHKPDAPAKPARKRKPRKSTKSKG